MHNKLKKQSLAFILSCIGFFFCMSLYPVSAANINVTVGYDPLTPNFTAGQKNVSYIILDAKSDTIAAAKIIIESSNDVEIIDVLDPVDAGNKPIPNVKTVDKKVSSQLASETVLIVQSGSALPSLIKVPDLPFFP
jgi:hypothetical protein